MGTPPAQASKPPLYSGHTIELNTLEPRSLEDFVYGTFKIIAPTTHSLEIIKGPEDSSDEGFDIGGIRSDGRLACIQCKRLSSKSLGLDMVAFELAKVALTSALENADVAEHLFIASGNVTKPVSTAVRENGRRTLRERSIKTATTHPKLKRLRDLASGQGHDISTTVDGYVHNLLKLEIISGRNYSILLQSCGDRVRSLIEHYFRVESFVSEHPRPHFDRATYLNSFTKKHPPQQETIELYSAASGLPANLARSNLANPLDGETDLLSQETGVCPIIDYLSDRRKRCIVLHGGGGSGKTTSLIIAWHRLSYRDGITPVFLPLAAFQGDLDKDIISALNVRHGSWTTLESKFVLLCDGLDEISAVLAQTFLNQLEKVLYSTENVTAVISLRSTGLRHPCSCSCIDACRRLVPLSFRQAAKLASTRLKSDHLAFLEQLRASRSVLHSDILFLPFGFAAVLSAGEIPVSLEQLLSVIVARRFEVNRRRQALPENLRDIPLEAVRALAKQAAFEVRVVRQRASISTRDILHIINVALTRLIGDGEPGVSNLTDTDAFTLLRIYEVILPLTTDSVRMAHDIIADYFAGATLATRWREFIGTGCTTMSEEAWIFASLRLPETERNDFIAELAVHDLRVAARCAVQLEKEHVQTAIAAALAASTKDDPVTIFLAFEALAIIATPECLVRLHLAAKENTDHNRSYQAKRGLARCGDRDYLEGLLEAQELELSSEFGRASSGGEAEFWWQAPPDQSLFLARSRLDKTPTPENVVLSLRTVSQWGDQSDWKLIERTYHWSRSLRDRPHVTWESIYALCSIDAPRATALVESDIAKTSMPDAIHLIWGLHGAGVHVENEAIFDYVVSTYDNSLVMDRTIEACAIKLIMRYPLSTRVKSRIGDQLENAAGDLRAFLWKTAAHHKLDSCCNVAIDAIKSRCPDEIGYASRFAAGLPGSTFQAEFLPLALASLQEQDVQQSWPARAVLDYLLSQHRSEDVARFVERAVVEIDYEIRRKQPEPTDSDGGGLRDHFTFLGYLCVAAKVARLIPADVRRRLINVNLSSANQETIEAYRNLLSTLPAADVDAGLSEIKDGREQMFAISVAVSLGSTAERMRLFMSCCPIAVEYLYSHRAVAEVIRRCWSREILEAVAKAIISADWTALYEMSYAHEIILEVNRRITESQVRDVIEPLLARASNDTSRRILQLWRGLGNRKRDT
jgi:hypothetical protein